jgi:hypothetical protein
MLFSAIASRARASWSAARRDLVQHIALEEPESSSAGTLQVIERRIGSSQEVVRVRRVLGYIAPPMLAPAAPRGRRRSAAVDRRCHVNAVRGDIRSIRQVWNDHGKLVAADTSNEVLSPNRLPEALCDLRNSSSPAPCPSVSLTCLK